MKNSPLTTFLLAVLAFSALLSVIFCGLYVSSTRQLRSLQGQWNFLLQRNTGVSYLAAEAVEYGKRNPAIDPILEATGFKPPRTASTATNKPAATK